MTVTLSQPVFPSSPFSSSFSQPFRSPLLRQPTRFSIPFALPSSYAAQRIKLFLPPASRPFTLQPSLFLPRGPTFPLCNRAATPPTVPSLSFSLSAPPAVSSPPPAPSLPSSSSGRPVLGQLSLGVAGLTAVLAGFFNSNYRRLTAWQGSRDSVGLLGLGAASGFNAVKYTCSAYDSYQEAKSARRVKDVAGVVIEALNGAKSVCITVQSGVVVVMEVVGIAALWNVIRIASAVTTLFLAAGSGILALGTLLGLGAVVLRIREQWQLRCALKECVENPEGALALLQARLSISPEERAEVKAEIEGKEKYRLLSIEQREGKCEKKCTKLLLKKERVFTRMTSPKAMALVQKASIGEAAEVVDAVKTRLRHNLVASAVLATLLAGSLTGVLLSASFSAGVPLLVAGGIGVFTAAALFIFDTYFVLQNYNNSVPGRHDRLFFLLSSLIGAGVISIAALFVAHPIGLLFLAVFSLLWFSLNLACYFRIRSLEQKQLSSS